MVYLSHFEFPTAEMEYDFMFRQKRTCYDTYYPFQILSKHQFRMIDFEPVTILYGGNGSGKTTALNVIAEKLGLCKDSLYNRSNFFEDYIAMCEYEAEKKIPLHSAIITSDDVFDFMLNLRSINEGIDRKREELLEEYLNQKYGKFQMRSLADYEQLKTVNLARRSSQSQYIRKTLSDNVREHSNGESAFLYFAEKIKENGLYLLDEPENSLSPEKQQELLRFLEDSARFFGCQFVIATHSPFLLSMRGAKIYDMDEEIVDVKKWYDLANMREYYKFFKNPEREFEEGYGGMPMKKLFSVLLFSSIFLFAGCSPKRYLEGQILEIQSNEDVGVVAFTIKADGNPETGILLTDETSIVSWIRQYEGRNDGYDSRLSFKLLVEISESV